MTVNNLVPLLEVEERFALNEGCLVLAPDFPLPLGRGWREFTFFVVVRTTGKFEARFRAVASPVHLNIRDPEAKRKGWRLTIVLHQVTKEEVPIGSSVLCERQVKKRLFSET